MAPGWSGSYNPVLVYQEFLLVLIALIGSLACLGALASLLFVCQECLGGSHRPTGNAFRPVSAGAAPDRAYSQAEFSTSIRLTPQGSFVVARDAGTEDVFSLEVERG
jgi:hypothetical protein